MIFDSNWSLLEAGGAYTSTYSEILAKYPPGEAGVRQLLADARVTTVYDNDLEAAAALASGAGSAPSRPATPGPLGEWRRTEGFEPPLNIQHEKENLEQWLAQGPQARQLPIAEDEIISPDQALAIDTETWAQWELYLLNPERISKTYRWVGIRIADVGVIGPFSTDSENAIAITGLGPTHGTAELLAWKSDSVALDQPDLVTPLTKDWQPPDVAIVRPTQDLRRAEVSVVTLAEASAVLTETQRGVGRESPES